MMTAPAVTMKAAAGEMAGADPTTMNAPTNDTADRTTSKALYNCHLDLLAFNASAISMVELATNCSIGALSMTVALRSTLVAWFDSASPGLGNGRLGGDERLPDE